MTLLSVDVSGYRWDGGQYSLTLGVTSCGKHVKVSAHWYPKRKKLPRFDFYHLTFGRA